VSSTHDEALRKIMNPTGTEIKLDKHMKNLGSGLNPDDFAREVSTLNQLLAPLDQDKSKRPRIAVLKEALELGHVAYKSNPDAFQRMALSPPINDLDRWMLEAVPDLSATLTNTRIPKAERLTAARELAAALDRLNVRLPRESPSQNLAMLSFVSPTGIPTPNLIMTLGNRGHLQGKLPTPRLLTMFALRPKLQKLLVDDSDADMQNAVHDCLQRVYLILHNIYRPDDTARSYAVQIYSERFPAAARASQSIVIYPTTVPNP
jgi:hypothetical protein